MPGFDTDPVGGGGVVYATNVDFSGSSFTSGTRQVTANGQLLIGSTATPNIRVGTLTAGAGIAITNGPGSITISNSGSINDLHTARYIVSAGGASDGANFTTIAAAIAAATGATGRQTIFIQPGTYTENLTLSPNVNLCAYSCDANGAIDNTVPNVTIIGTLTASFTGTCCLSGLNLQTNSATILTVSGANATNVFLSQCYINATNNTAISFTSTGGSTIYLIECNGNLGTTGIHFFDLSGTGCQIFIYYGIYLNSGGSTSVSTVSSNNKLFMRYAEMENAFTTSSTSATDIQYCDFSNGNNVGLIVNGTGTNIWRYNRIESGTAVALTIGAGAEVDVDYLSVQTSNANALNGAGTIKYGHIIYDGSSSKNNVTSQTVYVDQAVTSGVSQLVYSTTNNVLAGLATANSASLVTNSTGVPAWSGTMTNGQVIIGSTGATPTAATLSAGTGVSITNGAASITISSVGGGLTWSDNSGTFTASTNNGYFITAASTPTLPAAPNEGDQVGFILDAAATVTITGNTGQKIRVGGSISAAAGTCATSTRGNSINLIYRSTGTTWFSYGAPEGTWTIT
jgi:hypothetical protein